MLTFYDLVCRAAEKLPGACLILGQPEAWQIVSYYGLLAASLWLKRDRRPGFAGKMLVLIALFFLLVRPHPGFRVTFLDVGQGDCIVMQNDNGHVYIMDGGSTSKKDVGTYQILPFLKQAGIAEIEAAFVSHPDEDHISGIETLLEQSDGSGVQVKRLILPDASERIKKEELGALAELALKNDVPVYYIKAGDVLRDHQLRLKAVAPLAGMETAEMNEISEVLQVDYKEFSMLLTGDTTGQGEQDMLQNLPENLDIDVLKASHHGSGYSTPEQLLTRISPTLAIISAGKNNRYGHPHEALLNRLAAAGVDWLRTDEEGAITIWTDGHFYHYNTHRQNSPF